MTITPVEIRQKFRWYKEDATWLLSELKFMKLSAEERGVLHSLRLVAWNRGAVPRSPEDLQVLTRLDVDVLERVVPKLLSAGFFEPTEDGEALIAPQLEELMVQNHQSLQAQQEGGRRGGRKSRAPRVRKVYDEKSIPDTHGSDRVRSAFDD